ncbi:MAG TPA: lipase maturation factor family protein [Chthoniobacterales bacterium]|nr:lipase maturation factor family protein [Chthoniobacterales bacterium]
MSVDRLERLLPEKRSSYWLTRFVMLRLLGALYAIAFLVAANQILPLIGSDGLLPIGNYLARVSDALGGSGAGFRKLPSIFWFNHSDTALLTVAWIGFGLSCVVAAGYANAIMLALLWALYMSFVHVGQEWYGYGWEVQLLETGFLAIFLSPLLDARPFPKRPPPTVIFWLFRALIFRIMLGAGLIKIRGDASWRDLSALFYHFETQPIPNGLSRWFHFLPQWLLRGGTMFNHITELVAPWFVFWPRIGRNIAGLTIILFQLTIAGGGNLSFLNWLTILPALACFDDRFWSKILPRALTTRAAKAAAEAEPSRPMLRTAWAVAALIAVLSVQPILNLFSSQQIMNTSFDPLELVNTYGAFGSVGKERFNVVFEGTDAERPDAAAEWKEYRYKGLPVVLNERPPQIAPYHLRLDWQMWFAAMGSAQEYPWTLNLAWKLLHNDAKMVGLFASNPFPDKPPRYIRAIWYRYKFARPNSAGVWWDREQLGMWLPPLSTDMPKLREVLRDARWLPPEIDEMRPDPR